MRPDVYEAMAKVEDDHWWFRARRSICQTLISGITLPENACILDVGSGTGGNLAMLSAYGKVFAMEMDDHARKLANARGIVRVEKGMLPDAIPFAPQQFDLVAMCDVLEHVEDDAGTLANLHARLAGGGRLLITVPAFRFLWSRHDTAHHHKRRYTLPALVVLAEKAGFRVTFASYINFWLFPLVACVRIMQRLTGQRSPKAGQADHAGLSLPPAALNRLLEWVFSSERWLLRHLRLPFGVSIILLAEKPAA